MGVIKSLGSGVRALFRKQESERELDDELRDYLECAAEQNMRAGMSQEEAFRKARLEMGSMEGLRVDVREAGWESTLESFFQDVRFGARMLRKNPPFTCVAVLALALEIGANTAMFSVIEAVLLRPLPYNNAEEIVRVASTWDRNGTLTSYTASPPEMKQRSWASWETCGISG